MEKLKEEIVDDAVHLDSGVPKSYLAMIAPHFGKLKFLNLSCTNIESLPPSISTLSSLTALILKECAMLMELPVEIGLLKNLLMFDLEGTEIMYLPKEMGKLENLQCLRVSFSAYVDEYRDYNGIDNIIPRTMNSKFRKLEELSISVSPDAKWWEIEVMEAVLVKLHFLPSLKTLKLYLPTSKELQYFLQFVNTQGSIYSSLQNFSLKFGHSDQLPSYLKTKLVDSFEKLEKCLKYENGEGTTDEIMELIRHAKALFICHHWTIEKLSIFDISRLKYCLLAECNEMHTIVDKKDAFESLEYLAIHSMKNLQSIWKGPISGNSFTCLQVLALHTCPELTTIFTESMLDKLHSLTVIIVEDCPKVRSLVSWGGSSHEKHGSFLPNLKKILLFDLPELISLSSGVYIAPRLDTLLVFNCLKLDNLSYDELSRHVKEIKGESEWWDALKNNKDLAYSRAYVQLKRDGYLMNQLAEDTNSLKQFYKLRAGKFLFSILLFGKQILFHSCLILRIKSK
ncbi:disease resistance protein At4g27190-like [Bidens hawaiensis]|uniref:disease resistance protein At4g27190-like n=1 Tax=Bidens hawaiensis TaxID=980011 RepID=UPI00404AFB68